MDTDSRTERDGIKTGKGDGKPGPEPNRLKIEMELDEAVRKALSAGSPKRGDQEHNPEHRR